MRPTSPALAVLFLLFLAPNSQVNCLWPIPRQLHTGSTALQLSENFKFTVNIKNPPKDLSAAVQRFTYDLTNDKHQRLVVGRDAANRDIIRQAPAMSTVALFLQDG